MNTPTSKEIQVFNFNSVETRVVEKDGEPWFVVKDVCNILGLKNTTEALRGLDDDELTSETLMSGGQNREMKIVNESGMYALVIRSKKPDAKKFRKWITSEVLPSIRKHGGYAVGLPDFTNAVEAARAWADAHEKLLESQQAIEAQTKHIQEIEPKAKYTDDVLSSKNSYATTVIASNLGMSAIKLNRFLVAQSVQRKVSECWVLCVKYQNKGYDDILTGTIEGSTTSRSYKQMRWTELGQKFIIDLWNKCNEFKLEG